MIIIIHYIQSMNVQEEQIQHNMLEDQLQLSFKMDRMYINSLGYVRKSAQINSLFSFIKALYLVVLLSFYFQFIGNKSNFFAGLITAAGLSVAVGFSYILISKMTKSLSKNIIIAKQLDHIVEEPYDPNLRFDVFEDWISVIYNAKRPYDALQDVQTERIMAQIINHYYFVISKDLNAIHRFADISLFGIAIWMCVELGTNQTHTSFKIFLICYLVWQFLMHWKLVIWCLAIALCPLLCILVCIIAICSKSKKTNQQLINHLQIIDYRESVQLQHGVECMICFTNFYPDEKICILECPAKHAFHQICIKAWFNVGTTCPVCRHNFVQN